MKKKLRAALLIIVLLMSILAQADDIYISSFNGPYNGAIYKYDSSGNKTIFASGLMNPWGLAADKSDNIYTTKIDGHIYKYDINGNMSTYATGILSCSSLTFDKNDNLYITCDINGEGLVYKIDSSGKGNAFVTGLGHHPQGLAFDNNNNLYVAVVVNGIGTIEKFDSNGNRTTFASGLTNPRGLMFDSTTSSLYAAEQNNIAIYDLIGNTSSSITVDGGWPWGMAFDSSRNLFVADHEMGNIYKIDPSGNRTIFDSGLEGPYSIVIIPEPATLLLIGLGAVAMRKKR
ncbi:MAG: PEP-CTERM sorting domain-containing protein [Sedimentisphaerales bacterium]